MQVAVKALQKVTAITLLFHDDPRENIGVAYVGCLKVVEWTLAILSLCQDVHYYKL